MGIRENIIRLREIYGITQEELASIACVTRGAVSQWEGGFAEPRMGAIQKISDHFHIMKSNIIEDGGMDLIDPITKKPRNVPANAINVEPAREARVPLLGVIHAGEPIDPDTSEETVSVPYEIWDAHKDGFCLNVDGDCMDKVYPEGCMVYVDPNIMPTNGAVAAVCIDGRDAIMRRIFKGANTLILSPDSNNPKWEDIVISDPDSHEVTVIGKVVWFQGKVE